MTQQLLTIWAKSMCIAKLEQFIVLEVGSVYGKELLVYNYPTCDSEPELSIDGLLKRVALVWLFAVPFLRSTCP